MDDIYFSDRKGRRNDGNGSHRAPDRFTDGDRFDINTNPNLKKRSVRNDSDSPDLNFQVNIPDYDNSFDDHIPVSQPRSRTPQGPRKAPESRTPTAARRTNDSIEPPPYTPLERKRPAEALNTTRRPAPQGSNAPQKRPPAQRNAPVHINTTPQRAPAGQRTPSGQKAPIGKRPVQNSGDKKKPNLKVIIPVVVASLLLVLIVGILGYGYSILGNIDYDDTITENAYLDESELMSSPDVENILIIGSDARAEDNPEHSLVSGQRADSMILFSIDKKNKQLKLTSFLRDSYVYIPSEGYEDKLNAAYSLGGAQLTMDTLEYNFGVKIDSYLTVNFEVFKQFINLLGGVPVEVSEYEAEYMVEELKYIYIKPGVNLMNGNASLMYCRMRYLDNDFYRTQRQRKVIKAVVGQVAKTNLFKLTDIVRQVVPNIRTDISRNQLISLGAGAAVKFLHYDVVQQQIPADGTWWDENIGGADVIVFNPESNQEILKEFIFEKHIEETTEKD